MIRRPPRSTQSRSSAASDVYKRQCQHLIDGKWFDQVIVSSLVQSGNAFPDSIPRRDNQNGRPVAFGSELSEDLEPIHPREHQIKEKKVICLLDICLLYTSDAA